MRIIGYTLLLSCVFIVFACSSEGVKVVDTGEFRKALALPSVEHSFVLSAVKDTLIRTAKGIGIFIAEDAFVDASGQAVQGEVQLSVREVFRGAELFRENLSTTTGDGKLLATRGMLDIRAVSGDEELQLAPGKTLELFFPGDSTLYAGAQIFYGKENADGIMEWEADSGSIPSPTPINWEKQVDLEIFYHYKNHPDLIPDKDFFAEMPSAKDSLLKWMDLSLVEKRAMIDAYATIYWILFKDGDFEVYAITGDLPESTKKSLTRKLNNTPLMPAFYREGDKASVQGFIQLYFYEKENELLKNFRLSARRLGWVNCDIFYESDQPLTDVVVAAPNDTVLMNLVFKDAKAMVSGVLKDDGNVHFYDLPLGEPVQIVAVYPGGSGISFSLTSTNIASEIRDLASPQVISKEQLEEILNELF